MMLSEGELAEFRADAEALMTETCVVSYLTGDTTLDESTGRVVPESAVRFSSRCKVQARDLVARDAEVGGHVSTSVRLELHLPVGAPAVEVDDVAEITAVGALSDVQLLGRRFRIVAPVGKSFATARRLEVVEVVS